MSVADRRYRRVGVISAVGVAIAIWLLVVEVLIGCRPSPVGACSLALAGLLAGPFLGAWLDSREDDEELEVAILRRRVMFCPERPLTRTEYRRVARFLAHPPRNGRTAA